MAREDSEENCHRGEQAHNTSYGKWLQTRHNRQDTAANGGKGEDKPDIITNNFDIEIETGLKHDIRKLANLTKKTYVIVPNEAEKERYEGLLGDTNLNIITIYSYII